MRWGPLRVLHHGCLLRCQMCYVSVVEKSLVPLWSTRTLMHLNLLHLLHLLHLHKHESLMLLLHQKHLPLLSLLSNLCRLLAIDNLLLVTDNLRLQCQPIGLELLLLLGHRRQIILGLNLNLVLIDTHHVYDLWHLMLGMVHALPRLDIFCEWLGWSSLLRSGDVLRVLIWVFTETEGPLLDCRRVALFRFGSLRFKHFCLCSRFRLAKSSHLLLESRLYQQRLTIIIFRVWSFSSAHSFFPKEWGLSFIIHFAYLRVCIAEVVDSTNVDLSGWVLLEIVHYVVPHILHGSITTQGDSSYRIYRQVVQKGEAHSLTTIFKHLLNERRTGVVLIKLRRRVRDWSVLFDHTLWLD